MGVVFDEVSAEVATQRPAVEETSPVDEQPQQHRLKRELLQCIERRQRRERRLHAD
jgi:hypothetical protein